MLPGYNLTTYATGYVRQAVQGVPPGATNIQTGQEVLLNMDKAEMSSVQARYRDSSSVGGCVSKLVTR